MLHSTTIKNKIQKAVGPVCALAFWVLVWKIFSLFIGKEILLPSPEVVFFKLMELVTLGSFWKIIGTSFLNIMGGFLLGVLCGCVLAAATCAASFAHALVAPVMNVMKATPIASFIILAMVWLKQGDIAVFAVFLMVMPLIWGNVTAGIKGADRALLEMAQAFRFSKSKILACIYLPSVLPFLLSGATTAIGFAWKAGVAAEVLATPRHSIGAQMHNARVYLEMPSLFAWTVVVVLLSMLIEWAIKRLANAFSKERGHRYAPAPPK